MNWKIVPEETTDTVRVYKNKETGETCILDMIIKDAGGRQWWGFRDLFTIPFMRIEMSKHLAAFFGVGLTHQDLMDMFREMKALIKPLFGQHDPEKYEKLFSAVLQRENQMKIVTDPNVQYLTLATVYVLSDRENIELFGHEHVAEKLKIWGSDTELSAFFLTWYSMRIAAFIADSGKISQIVSRVSDQASS